MNSNVIGVDIGGSHITAAVVDLEKKQIVSNMVCRRAIDSSDTRNNIISAWSSAISRCTHFNDIENSYIGIAMPGPFDYEQGICYIKEQAKYKSLYSVNVKKELSTYLNIPPERIRFINDATSFLKGEVFAGAAQNCQTVFGFTLGTGFGSAFYDKGQLTDSNFWNRPFKEGIAEDYFSTRWFVDTYAEKTLRQVSGVKQLFEKFNSEKIVKEIFAEFATNLADFITIITKNISLEMLVLGGNISKTFSCFRSALKEGLIKQNLNFKIEQSLLNEDAILLGSASLWLSTDETSD